MTVSRRLLLHVALGAVLVIAGVAGVTYWLVYREAERLVMERLDTYVAERTRREEASFRLVYQNLETARGLYLRRDAQPPPADIQARWDALVRRDPDGGWRTLRERGDPSLWAHRDLALTPLIQHRLLNALAVSAELMPLWVEGFPSLYFSFPGAACLGYNLQQLTWAWDTPADYPMEEQEWYAAAAPARNPARGFVWTGVYPDPISRLPFATVMLPVYDKDETFVCVLAHDMHLDRLINEVTRSDYPGALHMIFRTDGRLIAHARLHEAILASDGALTVQDSGDPALVKLHALVTERQTPRLSGFEPVAKSYFSASKLALPGADWHFVTLMPRGEVARRALQSAQWVIWSGAALLALLLAILAGVLRNQISKPLAELTRATEAMAAGADTEQRAALSLRADELGALAASFRQMVSRVADREMDLRELNAGLEKRVDERTTELQQALEREKELGEMKSRFVSLVSHEFRTPLGVILSATDVLQRYFERLPPEKRERHLGMIFNSTKSLAALIEEVLLLGRVEEGRMSFKPEPLDLEKLCRALSDELRSATGGACPIHFQAETSLDGAVSDESLLRHILSNLLSNACKYSEPGSPMRFTVARAGDSARFVIADQGIGIPEADQARLFTSFTRGSNVGQRLGTGLGLVVVRRCVELHGGALDIHSAPDRGTTVTVTLPVYAAEPGSSKPIVL